VIFTTTTTTSPHLITHASFFITAAFGVSSIVATGFTSSPIHGPVPVVPGPYPSLSKIKRRISRKAAPSNSAAMSDAPAAVPVATPVRQHTFTNHSGQEVTVVQAASAPPTPPADPKVVEVKKVEQMAEAEAEAKKPEVVVVEKKPEEKKEVVVVEEKKPEEKKKEVVVVEEKKPEEKKLEPVVVVVDDKKPVEKKAVIVEEKKPEPILSALVPDIMKPNPTVVVVEDKKPEEKKTVIVEEKKPETVAPAVVVVPEKKAETVAPAVVVVPAKAEDPPKTVTTTITTTTIEEKKPTVTFVEEKKPVPVVAPVVEVDTFTIPDAVGIFTQYKAMHSTTMTLNKDVVTDSSGKSLFKVNLRFLPSLIFGPTDPFVDQRQRLRRRRHQPPGLHSPPQMLQGLVVRRSDFQCHQCQKGSAPRPLQDQEARGQRLRVLVHQRLLWDGWREQSLLVP
jgi:hypothetical protein